MKHRKKSGRLHEKKVIKASEQSERASEQSKLRNNSSIKRELELNFISKGIAWISKEQQSKQLFVILSVLLLWRNCRRRSSELNNNQYSSLYVVCSSSHRYSSIFVVVCSSIPIVVCFMLFVQSKNNSSFKRELWFVSSFTSKTKETKIRNLSSI